VDAVGAPHVGERTEKELITAFCDKIAELSPRLVTFNGHSFDLPVLRYRAMVSWLKDEVAELHKETRDCSR
jgi:predicted PolB exonuclease-like 3'-5' exonuclease